MQIIPDVMHLRSALGAGAALAVIGALWTGPIRAQSPAQPQPAQLRTGSEVYMQARCFACHGEFGFGGAGPRFRGDRFLGLTDYVIGQILVGRDIMPPYGETLSDDQVAAVATYVRNSWGNRFGPVQPQQVAAIRKDVKAHPPQGQPHLPESPPPAATEQSQGETK
ncbi:MAG TPA: cytochrome c [Xanthobacteraceae bacterium]|nr:cytochrome c [Xanthobacteraceae bacterium]